MPKPQATTYEDVFVNMLKAYQQVADKAFELNPDKEYVLKLIKSHACQLNRTGGPDKTPLFSSNCPDGWVQCPGGDCVPIVLGC